MARTTDSTEQPSCSFCGKSPRQVKKLIAGPGVHICDECVDLCNEIIAAEPPPSPECRQPGRLSDRLRRLFSTFHPARTAT